MKFNVPDMSCGHCRRAIEKAVEEADPMAELSFDMEARQIEAETELSPEALMTVLKEAGYPAEPA